MEEKKLDINSVIGFVLIFAILMFMLWQNQPTPEELEAQEKAKQEQIEADKKAEEDTKQDAFDTPAEDISVASASDSTQLVAIQNKLGAFAYSATLPSAKERETKVETELLDLTFSNKGGFINEVRLKQFVDYDSIPIYLIKDNNTVF